VKDQNTQHHELASTDCGLKASGESSPVKETWHEPKLTFVEPKLTNHGSLTEVTGQFFGGFSPAPPTS
jgi:hypothetical protein